MTDLASWQRRLAEQFDQLRVGRTTGGGDKPIFALEHGLDAGERASLAAAIRAYSAAHRPSSEHALPWIVYAAELGYRYAGDEYWQTFEAETPGWIEHGDRHWLRDCYRSFRQQFGGAEPSGAWAEHFSIICWPITHAILPQDLQRQLARILFDLRHSFSADLFESPQMLGEQVAARSWDATSRFQNFVQETQLVGLIATALLLQGEAGYGSLIDPLTLRRIGEDLDRERRVREWLRDARRGALERAHIRSLSLGRAPTGATSRGSTEPHAEVAALGIEPRIVLRPVDATASSWEVLLQIPNLSHLLIRFPWAREILTGSRCVVAGASGRPLARGRCLYGAPHVVLARWPSADEVLLQFEKTDLRLAYLLSAECLLRPAATRLFRVASDGLAYELRSLRVRPGGRYLIVSTAEGTASEAHAQSVSLNCQGARGALLEVPETPSADWELALERLGLGRARAVDVWPAGLAPVRWDGEGQGEWLASERPCLGVRADYALDALVVSVGDSGEHALQVTGIAPGVPTFVELPQLPIGLHNVHVGARGQNGDTEHLDIVMRIREARAWSAGANPDGPLALQLDPIAPTLEQLWEGRVEITLRGPVGRSVKCRVSLFDRESQPATVTRLLSPIPLPVRAEAWRSCFERQFVGASDVQVAYDNAKFCELDFTADELGTITIRCERKFTPLRWAVHGRGGRYFARVLDDSGCSGAPAVTRFAFETPCVDEQLEGALEYEAPAAGGLYVTRIGEFSAEVIVPPHVRTLADLGCSPRVDTRDRSVDAVLRSLCCARVWGSARLPGDVISATRQRAVLQAIALWIFRVVGGDGWANTELAVHARDEGIIDLKRAISKRREEVGVGAALFLERGSLAVAESGVRIERLASLATRYLSFFLHAAVRRAGGSRNSVEDRPTVDDPRWLAELALRLASDPAGVQAWSGQHLGAGIARLMEASTFAKAARFLVVATDQHLGSRPASGELYAGWNWQ